MLNNDRGCLNMSANNVVLIGFMGVGKTEVGKLLAKKLKMDYIDTDAIIEGHEKRPINDIFASSGEQAFRDMETETLDGLSGVSNKVISTGGGIVLRPENVDKLKKMGVLILLWSSPKTIFKRLKHAGNRPLLNVEDPMARINEILEFRTPIYKSIADFEVDTSVLSPEEACNRIVGFLRKRK